MTKVTPSLGLLIIMLCLVACGQKGPLYLPTPDNAAKKPPSNATHAPVRSSHL